MLVPFLKPQNQSDYKEKFAKYSFHQTFPKFLEREEMPTNMNLKNVSQSKKEIKLLTLQVAGFPLALLISFSSLLSEMCFFGDVAVDSF